MADSCVKQQHCGTHAPGWLNGALPVKTGETVVRQVCFNWGSRCCKWSVKIKVKKCSGGFFVYELQRTPVCHLRYCGNAGLGKLNNHYCYNKPFSLSKIERHPSFCPSIHHLFRHQLLIADLIEDQDKWNLVGWWTLFFFQKTNTHKQTNKQAFFKLIVVRGQNPKLTVAYKENEGFLEKMNKTTSK